MLLNKILIVMGCINRYSLCITIITFTVIIDRIKRRALSYYVQRLRV